MKPQLPRQQAETFELQERIGALMSENAKLKGVITDAVELLKSAEKMLRNTYDLDAETADEQADNIRSLVIRIEAR